MKVYGWSYDGKVRAIVAARSFAEASRVVTAQTGIRTAAKKIAEFGCETGNAVEVEVARDYYGVVLFKVDNARKAEAYYRSAYCGSAPGRVVRFAQHSTGVLVEVEDGPLVFWDDVQRERSA